MARRLAGSRGSGLIVAAVLAVLSACSSLDSMTLATSRAGMFTNGCPAARIDGVLLVDGGAGTAIVSGGERYGVVWPYGFSGHRSGDVVEVLDGSGRVVARTGETVALGGGILGEGRWFTCGPPLERH
jgi:hypothetical protein